LGRVEWFLLAFVQLEDEVRKNSFFGKYRALQKNKEKYIPYLLKNNAALNKKYL
jgi:hypothetical protein